MLDILAIDNADRRLNVEVQRTKPTWEHALSQQKKYLLLRSSSASRR